jgi:serine/threonine protein phosphatase PrpC
MTAPDTVRLRQRLVRGPVTIGEPAALLQPRLSAAEPYRPDTIADGGEAFGMTVRAASVRGLAKRFEGKSRQDDLCLACHEPTGSLLIAVADGVSGAARSELGAALAVRYATATLARQLGAGALDWPAVFRAAAWALVEEYRRFSGDRAAGPAQAAGELATTLLVAAVADRRVRVAALGDSPAFALLGRNFRVLAGEAFEAGPEAGLIGGAVASLPRSLGEIRSCDSELAPGEVLLLCTDGLALPLAGGDGDVGRVLSRELRCPPDAIDFARLLDFSRATYDDDRTLVAVWPADGRD